MNKRLLRLFLNLILIFIFSGIHTNFAMAQTVLGPADPARVNEQSKPIDRQWQRLESPASPQKVVPMTPEGAEDARFVLNSLTIEGMTAYTQDEVKYLYAAYLGQEISVATLFEIMAALQQKYLEDGYSLTKVVIPGQSIEGGNATLTVIEGYVSQVDIAEGIPDGLIINDAKRRILAMHPLNTFTLERILLILNDLPGLNVSAILASIRTDDLSKIPPGAVRLVLDKNVADYTKAELSFDNYGSVFAGPYQFSVLGHIPHVGPEYSELSLGFVGATSLSEQRFAMAQYELPLFGVSGASLFLEATQAHTEPGSDLDILDIKGESRNLSMEVEYPFIKQRAKSLVFNIGFEVKNSQTDILGEQLYDDRQRIFSTGAIYSFSDTLYGVNVLDFDYSHGANILGARETGSDDLSRLDGHSDFSKANIALARIQSLPSNFQIYSILYGQYTNVPLLSSEEFGYGGKQIGRGYNPSEIVGDRGVSASFEVRKTQQVKTGDLDVTLEPYLFFDIGKVWNIDNNDTVHMSAAAAGFGTRFSLENAWNGDVTLGYPLTRPAEDFPKYSNEYGPRLLFSLNRRF